MYRALKYYWRVNLAVMLGAGVATAVLTGALLVGDSVRGSLRQLTLERLGSVDQALVSHRFFPQTLAERLAGDATFAETFDRVVAALAVRGSAVQADAGTRASQVAIYGVDDGFAALFGDGLELDFSRGEGQVFPSVIINEALALELGAGPGDPLLLNFGYASEIPRDTLMGEKDPEDVLGAMRLTVASVLPDSGPGRFGLTPQQQQPLNAYVSRLQLQRALDQRGRVNALFVSGEQGSDDDLQQALARVAGLEDLGFAIDRGDGFLSLESDEFVLRPNIDDAVREATAEIGAPTLEVQSYLANEIRFGATLVPYSLIAALDPRPGDPWHALFTDDGRPVTGIADDEILLGEWAAADLGAGVGDELEIGYYVVGPREELTVETTTFRVGGVLAFRGLARDRELTPDYPGMQDAEDITGWDPPFPVDLQLIRPQDEKYWDDYRATPKAFVSRETGRRLWSTRYGSTTMVRVGVRTGADPAMIEDSLRQALLTRMAPDAFGLQFQPVKEQGLAASKGATDFAEYFIYFSFFLIVSSALLVGLLFNLNVEQRARDIGLLLAVGYPVARVRRGLMAEGVVLAVGGAILGLGGGVGYAWLLMVGLRTIWLPAMGTSALYLHVSSTSLAAGIALAIPVVLFSIYWAVRRLVRVAPPSLLAGSVRQPEKLRRRWLAPVLAWGSTGMALAIVAYAVATGTLASMELAFGSGTLLLVAGLAFFAMWCRGSRRRRSDRGPSATLLGMAARSSAWSPGRSILSVALVAFACFVIVAVAANRGTLGEGLDDPQSGTGGFALVAESDVPLHQDLNRRDDRLTLGFSAEESAELDATRVVPFRYLPGDDASCLNLYQPERPRVLGVPPEMIDRGGFPFGEVTGLPDGETNPWRALEQDLGEPGVIPAIADVKSTQWILHIGLGDDVVLEDEYGRPVRLRLVGVLENTIFQSELLVSERNFLQHFPSRTGYSYFLVDTPSDTRREVVARLESRLAPYGFDSTTTADKLAAFQIVEHTYLSTFQTLGALGLLLGTLGLGVILVRNVIERRGELATLRAFGFRRRSLALIVLAENLFLLVVGMAVGVLSALAAVAPRLAAIHVEWTGLWATLAVILAVGMLSSVVAVAGTLRIPLLPALKAER